MNDEIYVLCLPQPDALLVVLGLKGYEIRHWRTRKRGKVAICASTNPIRPGKLAQIADRSDGRLTYEDLSSMSYFYGGIIGLVELTAVRKIVGYSFGSDRMVSIHDQTPLERAVGDWREGRFAWEFSNASVIPQPIPMRGGPNVSLFSDQVALNTLRKQLESVA